MRLLLSGIWVNLGRTRISEKGWSIRGERELVEAASNDRVWGVGFDETLKSGELGKTLMSVRERLRGDVEEDP